MSKFQNPVLHFGLSLIFVIHRSFGSLNSVNVHRNLIRVFPRISCANSAIPLQFDLAVSRHCSTALSLRSTRQIVVADLEFLDAGFCRCVATGYLLSCRLPWSDDDTTPLSVHSTLLQCTSALHVCSIFGAFCSLSASLLSYRYFVDIVFGINGPQC